MNRAQSVLVATVAATALMATCAAGSATGVTGTGERPGERAPHAAPSAALQAEPTVAARPTVRFQGRTYAAPNPYLAQLPDGAEVDWSYWRHSLETSGQRRTAAGRRSAKVPPPVTSLEWEPVGRIGDNDVQARSQRIAGLGVEEASQAALVLGRLSAPPVPTTAIGTAEDQGSIRLGTPTGIGDSRRQVTVASRIGDGPHGRARSRRGDFDFFKVRGFAGQSISANTAGSRLDTILVLYDAAGRILAVNDDTDDLVVQSSLAYDVTRTADYYVMVAGYSDVSPTPVDPFRSGSGRGAGDEGTYRLQVTSAPLDRDHYGVRLDVGDVLAGSLTGRATTVTVHRADGRQMIGSQYELSSLYPMESPLPGGGASFAYVAEEPGWYAVSARDGVGNYRLLLETYRPGTESAAPGAVQTVFLDFDGARINTNVFGGPGVSTLSPMSSFLGRWGLSKRDNAAVVAATVGAVKENIRDTLAAQGLNPDLRVRVLNSRNHPDPFGQPNVSRVVVGGTVVESGVPTIGVAQSIDPGNYGHRESALVLLDVLSAPAGPRAANSLNTYLKPGSDRIAFVGRAVGNVVSHEVGHFVGSFHTDNANGSANLMDAGGKGVERMFGVGPDRVGGTADDPDVDFGEDRYLPDEGLTGVTDTLNTSAWAFRPGATP